MQQGGVFLVRRWLTSFIRLATQPPQTDRPSATILDNTVRVKTLYQGKIAGWDVIFFREGKWHHYSARKDGEEPRRINLGADSREAWIDFFSELALLDADNNI
jgi:hypothetical protein